ncbi:1-deoxy-D-xylulose-5-phosphate synthase [Klebsiella pneumoniae]|nr:1-deoxy-D-xylulose-5-phosphate synthase [Klebsiella pneumoniae]
MNALSVFSFQENHPVRVVLVNGEPWFVAVDVCKALGLTNPTKSVSALDEDEKQLFSGDSNFKLGSAGKGAQSLIILNESGLYTLILRCRDAVKQGTTAWRFRKWVTNEVSASLFGKAVNTATSNPRQKAPVNHWTGGKRKNYAA